MAAGNGSRYGGLKQLAPVGPCGEILADYAVYDAGRAGFENLVFVVRGKTEPLFRETVNRKFGKRFHIAYVCQDAIPVPDGVAVSPERTKPWGTGHAVLAAESAVTGSFAVMNADDYYGPEAFCLLADHLRGCRNDVPDFAMAGYILENTLSGFGGVSRGLCRTDADGFLREVQEVTGIKKQEDRIQGMASGGYFCLMDGNETVSMNLWGFTPAVFDLLHTEFSRFLKHSGPDPDAEFYLPHAISNALERGQARVRVLKTSEQWFGMTYAGDRDFVGNEIRERIRQGLYPECLTEER